MVAYDGSGPSSRGPAPDPSARRGSIEGVKVSVSLREEDVSFLDDYARANGLASRSAALAGAVALLRSSILETAYVEAFQEWDGSDDAQAWEGAVADGVDR